MRRAGAQLALEIVGPRGCGHEIGRCRTRECQRHGDEGIALGFNRGTEVVVSDLRHDHVSFLSPSPNSAGQANAGEETGQKTGDFEQGRRSLSWCVHGSGKIVPYSLQCDSLCPKFVKVNSNVLLGTSLW